MREIAAPLSAFRPKAEHAAVHGSERSDLVVALPILSRSWIFARAAAGVA